jgi:hypothetical protein
MKRYSRILLACIGLSASAVANAESWLTSTIKRVYPLGDGSFVLIMTIDAADCAGTPGNKYHYVRPGVYGVTSDGVRAMLATALTAFASGKTVSIAFDQSSSSCDINRLTVNQD